MDTKRFFCLMTGTIFFCQWDRRCTNEELPFHRGPISVGNVYEAWCPRALFYAIHLMGLEVRFIQML